MRKSFPGSRKRWELRERPYFYARKPLAVPIKRLAQGRLTESLGLVLEDSDVIKITHLLSSAVCLCATVRAGGQIDASWMHDDERLSRMVSITSLVEHVGDISAELQKQTGIRFEIDDSSGGSTGPILVSVRDLRAWELMDAIWSLFSYKHAPWKLTRQERGHDAVYTLTVPRKAVEYASVIERDMYDSFFRHAETMIRASKLPPEGRHEMLDEIAQSLLEDNPEAFRPFLDDESLWSGLRIFSEVVDPGAFSAVLRGGADNLRVPVSRLSDRSQQFVHSVWQKQASNALMKVDGKMVPVPPPTFISLRISGIGSYPTPSLYIDMEHLGGYSYLGGVPFSTGFMKRLRKLWLNPGDAADHKRTFEVVKLEQAPTTAGFHYPIANGMVDISKGARQSIVARLSPSVRVPSFSVANLTIGQILEIWQSRRQFMSKWRGKTLLIDTPSWFLESRSCTPWRFLERIRVAAAASGRMPLEVGVEACITLHPDQLARLSSEFPLLRNLIPLRSVLLAAGSTRTRSRALAEVGAPITGILLELLQPFVSTNDQRLAKARAVRIREYPSGKSTLLPDAVQLEVYGSDSTWTPIYGFEVNSSRR